MRKSNDEFIRERAELAGVDLSDSDVAVLRKKWESSPTCSIDDLLAAVRRLRETPREPLITTPEF